MLFPGSHGAQGVMYIFVVITKTHKPRQGLCKQLLCVRFYVHFCGNNKNTKLKYNILNKRIFLKYSIKSFNLVIYQHFKNTNFHKNILIKISSNLYKTNV